MLFRGILHVHVSVHVTSNGTGWVTVRRDACIVLGIFLSANVLICPGRPLSPSSFLLLSQCLPLVLLCIAVARASFSGSS